MGLELQKTTDKNGLMEQSSTKGLPTKFYAGPVSNIKQALECRSPSIGAVKREEGLMTARAVLYKLIVDVVKFLNVGKTMNETQIAQTADLILEDFPHLKAEDLDLCFRKAKKGTYGKQYDRIDGQLILGWISEYDWERQDIAANMKENEHKIHKREELQGGYAPEVVQAIRKVVKNHESSIETHEKIEIVRPKNQQVDMIQRWMKQFDNLYGKYGEGRAIRTLLIGGVRMDINQFLDKKINNKS